MHRLRKNKNPWGIGAILLKDFYPQRDGKDPPPLSSPTVGKIQHKEIWIWAQGTVWGKGRCPALPGGEQALRLSLG